MTTIFSDNKTASQLRTQIQSNLASGSAKRIRELFKEINPQLVGDKKFESRWTDKRIDAAILIPIILRPHGASILLTVRSSKMPSHPGQISFPGGKVDPSDENLVATALREAQEEVNIKPHQVDVIGELGVHKGGLGFSVTPIVGLVSPEIEIKPCPREVHEVFEVPLSFFVDLNNHKTEEFEHKGTKYNMFAAPY